MDQDRPTENQGSDCFQPDDMTAAMKEIVDNLRNDFDALNDRIKDIKDEIREDFNVMKDQIRVIRDEINALKRDTCETANQADELNASKTSNLDITCRSNDTCVDVEDGESDTTNNSRHQDRDTSRARQGEHSDKSDGTQNQEEKIEQEKTFTNLFRRFVESSTLHGFPKLADSATWIRLLWILAMAGSILGLSIQIIGITNDYLAYSVNTDVRVKQGNMTWPDITVCNNRRYLASKFVWLPMFAELYDQTNTTSLADIFDQHYHELTPDDLLQLGADRDETIAIYTYPGEVPSRVETRPYYGSCYNIQPPAGTTFIMVAMNLHPGDSIDVADKQLIMQIYFKDRLSEHPFYHPYYRIDVGPGFESDQEITYDIINRLNGSYGQCQDNEKFFFERTGIAYEQQACLEECEFRHILSKCRCMYYLSNYTLYFPFWLKETQKKTSFPLCNMTTDSKCVFHAYRDQKDCSCKPKCHTKLTSDVKSLTFDLSNVDCLKEPDLILCTIVRSWAPQQIITQEWLNTNIAASKIFFTQKPFKTYTQQPSYPLLRFVSDFGGTMGLYLGASLLTYFELVQLLVSSVLYLFCKRNRSNA